MGLTRIKTDVIEDGSITSDNIDDATIVTGDIASTTIASSKLAVDPTDASTLNAGDVPVAQLGNASTGDTSSVRDDIALLAFKTQTNGNLARYNLVDQFVDAFEDTSGVDAAASTNEVRDSSGKYYSGSEVVVVSTTGGSPAVDGDYTVTTFNADGTYTTDTAQVYDVLVVGGGGTGGTNGGGGGGAGGVRYMTSFPVAAGSFPVSAAGGTNSFSTISASGGGSGGSSNAQSGSSGGSGGGASGPPAGSPGNSGGYSPAEGFPGGGGTTQTGGGGGGATEAGYAAGTPGQRIGGPGGDGLQVAITGTPTYFGGGGGGGRHRAHSNPSGGLGGDGGGGDGGNYGTNSPAPAGTANTGGGGGGGGGTEYITGGPGGSGGTGVVILRRPTGIQVYDDMTLVSNATTAQAAPTKGDIVMTYTDGAGTATINTDLTAEFSADNGSTYTSMTLALIGTTGGHTILTANNVTRTSSSGTSMRYRIKTFNQSILKQTRIHAVALGWS